MCSPLLHFSLAPPLHLLLLLELYVRAHLRIFHYGTLAHMGFHLPLPPHLPWLASCLPVSLSVTPSTQDPTFPFLSSPQDSDWVMSAEQTHLCPSAALCPW